jgi:uncharacterized membrane protein
MMSQARKLVVVLLALAVLLIADWAFLVHVAQWVWHLF